MLVRGDTYRFMIRGGGFRFSTFLISALSPVAVLQASDNGTTVQGAATLTPPPMAALSPAVSYFDNLDYLLRYSHYIVFHVGPRFLSCFGSCACICEMETALNLLFVCLRIGCLVP